MNTALIATKFMLLVSLKCGDFARLSPDYYPLAEMQGGTYVGGYEPTKEDKLKDYERQIVALKKEIKHDEQCSDAENALREAIREVKPLPTQAKEK
jgi:hypothetical protein